MRLALLLAPLFVVGCTDPTSKDNTPTETGDSAPQYHPNVPDGYEYKWDTDGCGDSGTDTQIYMLAEGSTDASGHLEMQETWYWFFGGDWEDDCIDVIQYSADAVGDSVMDSLQASEAEEGYEGTMTKTEDGCPGMNYLYLWNHPDKRDWQYGDGLDQDIIVIFDTLTPWGVPNQDNAMLVFMYYDLGRTGYRGDADYARGVFLPDTEDLAPPAHYTWEGSMCVGESG